MASFEEHFQAADTIGDGAALDCLGRSGWVLSNSIAPGNAESKWHQCGIFVEDIEAHSRFSLSRNAGCCSMEANLAMHRQRAASPDVMLSSMGRQFC